MTLLGLVHMSSDPKDITYSSIKNKVTGLTQHVNVYKVDVNIWLTSPILVIWKEGKTLAITTLKNLLTTITLKYKMIPNIWPKGTSWNHLISKVDESVHGIHLQNFKTLIHLGNSVNHSNNLSKWWKYLGWMCISFKDSQSHGPYKKYSVLTALTMHSWQTLDFAKRVPFPLPIFLSPCASVAWRRCVPMVSRGRMMEAMWHPLTPSLTSISLVRLVKGHHH